MGLLGAFTLRLTLLLWFAASFAFALPTGYIRDSSTVHHSARFVTRDRVSETATYGQDQGAAAQGSASDGAGSGFDVPAVLWLSFGLAVGLFLTLGGMRLWRATTAFAVGLVVAVCAWVAIINIMGATGLSDLVITLITLTFFLLGSLGGLFKLCHLAGLASLGILGGMSVGIRVVLMREGLLLKPMGLNWIIIAFCGLAGFVATLLRQRIGVALSCTFTGTFFLSLGIDLAAHKQNGVSRGLRHLFDGNRAHVLALREIPYKPSLLTQIILGISIGLAIVMASVQVRLFSAYIEEPGHARPLIQQLSSIYRTESTEKRDHDRDTLRLPLQKPPPEETSFNGPTLHKHDLP